MTQIGKPYATPADALSIAGSLIAGQRQVNGGIAPWPLPGSVFGGTAASVADIDELMTFQREGKLIAFVRDTLRGGNFSYVSEANFVGVPDYGISFPAQDGGYWVRIFSETINVKWFGAKGDYDPTTGIGTDDTLAIQNSISAIRIIDTTINSIQTGGNAKLVFPIGIYVISDTLPTSRYCNYEAEGNNVIFKDGTDGTVTCFSGDAWGSKIKGFKFSGFNKAISLNNFNRNSGKVIIEDCVFENDNLDLEIQLQSTSVEVRDCVFKNSLKIANLISSDKITFSGCWFAPTGNLVDLVYSYITVLDGYLVIRDAIGVPPVFLDTANVEQSWIEMKGGARISCINSRFGGERGGLTLVNCIDSVYSSKTYITITDSYIASMKSLTSLIPAEKRISCVRVFNHYPRMIKTSGVSSDNGSILMGFSYETDIPELESYVDTDYETTPYLQIETTDYNKPFSDSDRIAMGLLSLRNRTALQAETNAKLFSSQNDIPNIFFPAYRFNGVDSYLTAASPLIDYRLNPFSVKIKIKVENINTQQLIYAANFGTSSRLTVSIFNTRLIVAIYNGSVWYSIRALINVGLHDIVYTKSNDQTSGKIYIDGEQKVNELSTSPLNAGASGRFIGGNATAFYFQGSIYSIIEYSEELEADNISFKDSIDYSTILNEEIRLGERKTTAKWIDESGNGIDFTNSNSTLYNKGLLIPSSENTAAAVGATYTQAEVQAILTELRDLKTKMRTAGLLAT